MIKSDTGIIDGRAGISDRAGLIDSAGLYTPNSFRYDPTLLNPYLYVNATNALDALQTPALDLDPRSPAGDIALITATNSNGT